MEIHIDERKEKILALLNREGKVKVSELSRLFNISEVTIRMDLADLEQKGLLSRVHGGAVSSYRPYYNMSWSQRSSANEAEKKAIAAYIQGMVRDSDTIMMNAGTTTLFVLRMLSQYKDIKIVTNSIAIALEASNNSNFHVVLLGGSVNTKYQFTYGTDALRQLSAYHADKLILSVDGLDAEAGLTTYYHQEAEICRTMLQRADVRVVAADYTKMGRVAFAGIASLDAVDDIITNNKIDAETMSTFKKVKANLIFAE
ncbi:MAG: DeoR/GlpR transcriptional regulator [Clostridia bacterium]|nr:DeoR/GlpR transcriptional regulator [Clostridia bacterium]